MEDIYKNINKIDARVVEECIMSISRHSKQNGIGGLRKKIALEHLNSIETKTARFLN